jgi:hypothetical protein
VRIAAFAVTALLYGTQGAVADDCRKPVGPELAPKQIGYLLSAGPQVIQQSPAYFEGVGALAWHCDYRVGNAQITLIVATHPSDPMPCKRKVTFE